MIPVLLVVLSLVGLAMLAYGAIRLEQGRRRRVEEAQWRELATLLDAELRVGEDGRPQIRGHAEDVDWEVRAGGLPRFVVRFEGADRLAPASVFRASGEEEEESASEASAAMAADFRLLFRVDEAPVPAGTVRWLEDREIQDLLVTIHPLAARVVDARTIPPIPTIEIALDPASWSDGAELLTIRSAIDWARRMAHLAREGEAAAPPH